MDDQAQAPPAGPFLVVPYLPPSSNHIYVTNWRRKIRFLTKEAETFKRRMITLVTDEKGPLLLELQRQLQEGAIYSVQFVHYFEPDEILNKTFGAVDRRGIPKKGAAESRYKKMDIGNRTKLVEDAFSKALGVDDSLFFHVGHTKACCAMTGGLPQIHIFFDRLDPRRVGL